MASDSNKLDRPEVGSEVGSEVEGSEVEGSEVEGSEVEGSEVESSEIERSEIERSEIEGSEVKQVSSDRHGGTTDATMMEPSFSTMTEVGIFLS